MCPAPCERACIFSTEEALAQDAIGIRELERYAADAGRKKIARRLPKNIHGKNNSCGSKQSFSLRRA